MPGRTLNPSPALSPASMPEYGLAHIRRILPGLATGTRSQLNGCA